MGRVPSLKTASGSSRFPADDPGAIKTLIHITHLSTRQMARTDCWSIQEVFQIAVAADKYDLRGCLGLWPKEGCASVLPAAQKASEVQVLAQLGWIAWDDDLVDGQGKGLEKMDLLKTMSVLDHLAACRKPLVNSLLRVLEDTILKYGINTRGTSALCRGDLVAFDNEAARIKARSDCDAAILGSLIQGLVAENLFPLPVDAQEVFEGVGLLRNRLVRVVSSIKTPGLPGSAVKPSIRLSVSDELHTRCKPKDQMLSQLDHELRQVKCEATPMHVEHLERMRKEIEGGC
ncbi:unnamed protein product [Discula destructiva]